MMKFGAMTAKQDNTKKASNPKEQRKITAKNPDDQKKGRRGKSKGAELDCMIVDGDDTDLNIERTYTISGIGI